MQPALMELPEFEVKKYWHQRHETNLSVAWLLERLEVLLLEL